jgi:uncharacterized protein (TIGR03435 family)
MFRAFAILLAGLLLRVVCLAHGPTFDAASVKLSDSDVHHATYSGGPGTSDPGRIRYHIDMVALLQGAFGIQVDQIMGGPAWLGDFSAVSFYDIDATMPASTTKDDAEKMLQNLLAERFHLAFHRETRNAPGYELVVDKGGSKLKEAASNPSVATNGEMGPDGFPAAPGTRVFGYSPGAHQRRKYQEYTMANFATSLGFLVGRAQGKPVEINGSFQPRIFDKTGLTGKYTFILDYNCPACAPLAAASPPQDTDPGGLPDLFRAIQKQLGLRLDKAADLPMDVIVVESLDKIPTAN